MTKANGIATMTAKLFLTAALAIGGANIVLADDDGHGEKRQSLVYLGAGPGSRRAGFPGGDQF